MKFALSFDIFSQQVGFTLNGKPSYPTYSGFLFSMLTILLSLYLVNDTFFNWLYQTNPSITTEKRVNEQTINKFNNDYFTYLQEVNMRTFDLKIIKYNTSCPMLSKLNLKNDIIDYNLLMQTRPLEMDENHINCRFPNYTIVSKQDTNDSTSSNIVLTYFPNDFESILSSNNESAVFLNLMSPEIILKVNNISNLIKKDSSSYRIPIVQDESSIYRITIRKESYTFAGSYIFNQQVQKRHDYYPLNTVERLGGMKWNHNLPYLVIIFQYDKTHIYTNINYLNEQDLISSIGGSFGLMTLLGAFLNSIFASLSLESYLINKFYTLYDGSSESIKTQMRKIKSNNFRKSSIAGLEDLKHMSDILKERQQQSIIVSQLDVLQYRLLCRCLQTKKLKILGSLADSISLQSDYVRIGKTHHILERLLELLVPATDTLYTLLNSNILNINDFSSIKGLKISGDHHQQYFNVMDSSFLEEVRQMPDYFQKRISATIAKYNNIQFPCF